MAAPVQAIAFAVPDLQAVYDTSATGEIVLADGKPFIVDGNAMAAGNPFFIVQNTGVNVLEFNNEGGFVRGALIADGAFASLREVRFTSDNIGSPGWQFRPRTDVIPSGPGLLAFDSTISSATQSTLNQLQLFPESQEFNAAFDKISTMAGVTLTVDFTPTPAFGAFIGLDATIEYAQTTSLFGAANVVKHAQRYQPQIGAGAITIGPIFTFVHLPVISANGIAGIVHSQTRDFSSQPVYQGDGGTLAVVLQQQFLAAGAVNSGATVTTRFGYRFQDTTGAGSTGTQRAFCCEGVAKGTVENTGFFCNQVAGAINRFIRHEGTSQSDFGGAIGLGAGATVDWIISRVSANLASLADGDSLRITTGSLFFGTSGTTRLFEGVANRLDLATGDSFNIVSGNLTHTGTNVGFFGNAGATQAADPVALTDGGGGAANNATVAIVGSGDDANINDNFADVVAKINALRDIVRRHGLAA